MSALFEPTATSVMMNQALLASLTCLRPHWLLKLGKECCGGCCEIPCT